VISLNSSTENKFRMIDHRSIEYIIIKNTKYVLKKSKKTVDEINMSESDSDTKLPKWDLRKLALGNWFSSTRYY
jgi:hypothetical protein